MENRVAMDIPDDRAITILHFNDVYNIDSSTPHEPVGGACRFLTAINEAKKGVEDPIVIFSGDAFSPSMCKLNFLGVLII
jgi:5'-nucleotidase